MIRNAVVLLVFSGLVLLNSGCKRETEKQILECGCFVQEFSVPSWYSDSIYYADNKISRIDVYYRKTIEKNTQARFDYSDSEVKISVRDILDGSPRDFIHYTLSYNQDLKISQVDSNGGRVRANYFYEGDHLKYLLYSKANKITDSIAVTFDPRGKNILSALWYNFDQETKKYRLINTAAFHYDNKINPHQNSVHFLYKFYDCKEYSLDYFNTNNFTAIQSSEVNIRADYTYNEFDYPVYVIYYDGTNQETDRDAINYDCR